MWKMWKREVEHRPIVVVRPPPPPISHVVGFILVLGEFLFQLAPHDGVAAPFPFYSGGLHLNFRGRESALHKATMNSTEAIWGKLNGW